MGPTVPGAASVQPETPQVWVAVGAAGSAPEALSLDFDPLQAGYPRT